MYRILVGSFSDNPVLYFVPKSELEKYIKVKDKNSIRTDLRVKDWIYGNTDIIKKIAKKRLTIDIVS